MGKSLPSQDWCGKSLSDGRYFVRAKLGEGGMGFVYRALDRNLDAEVVIKVPRRAMLEDPEFAGRFAREVRSLVKLAHPRIVKVTDVGEHDGVPYAVMQYLSGGSLEDSRAAHASAATALAALPEWLPDIAAALDFVHTKGYVHRDVKPGNILFDAHHHAFLSDFGIAKAIGATPEPKRGRTAATGAGLVLGTPEYMAPELVMGQPFDGRIDQYALAVTVFEMLTGRYPFVALSATATLVLQTTQIPPELRALDPSVPPGVSDAVARALAKDPLRRFPTCGTFAAAVLNATPDANIFKPKANPPATSTHRTTGRHALTRPVAAPRSGTAPVARPPVPPSAPPIRTVAMAQPLADASPIEQPLTPDSGRFPTALLAALVAVVLILGGVVGTLAFRARGTVAASLVPPPAPQPIVVPPPPPVVDAPPTTGILELDLSDVPAHASISIDGNPLKYLERGEPQTLSLGTHDVVLTGDGFDAVHYKVTVTADRTTRLVLARPAASSPPPPSVETATIATTPALKPFRSQIATFTRVPEEKAVENQSLETILAAPSEFSNQVMIPTGLFVIAKHAQLKPDGTILGAVAKVKFAVQPGSQICQVQQADAAKPILLESGFAHRLAEVHALQLSPTARSLSGNFHQDFGDSSAVLTIHVVQRVDVDDKTWEPMIHEAEFLTGMNFWRIGEEKFGNSFKSLILTPDGVVHNGISRRTDWRDRINAKYLAEVRHLVHKIKDAALCGEMQQIETVMEKNLSNIMQANAAAQRAFEQRLLHIGR